MTIAFPLNKVRSVLNPIKNREGTSHKFQIRILAVYCLLILLSFSGAVLAIRRFLMLRLEARIEQALAQEIQELRVLVAGKDPETAQPFGENITAIYDVFLKLQPLELKTLTQEIYTKVKAIADRQW